MSLTDKALPVVADSRLSRLRAPRRKSSQDSRPSFAFCDDEEDGIFPLCVNLAHLLLILLTFIRTPPSFDLYCIPPPCIGLLPC